MRTRRYTGDSHAWRSDSRMQMQMRSVELFVVIVLFMVGYWLVSAIWSRWSPRESGPNENGAHAYNDAGSGSPASGADAAWHEVLGVAPDASESEIRASYRDLIDRYHPDKVERMGPEIQELTRRMAQKINLAYEAAMTSLRHR